MAKEGLTIEKLVDFKVEAEMSILKHIRAQVEWFERETEIPVDNVYVHTVDCYLGHMVVTDVTLEIKL